MKYFSHSNCLVSIFFEVLRNCHKISTGLSEICVQVVDMSKSGYDVGGKYMYFKAGVYNQNNTGDPDDYVQATFYKITKSHSKYTK